MAMLVLAVEAKTGAQVWLVAGLVVGRRAEWTAGDPVAGRVEGDREVEGVLTVLAILAVEARLVEEVKVAVSAVGEESMAMEEEGLAALVAEVVTVVAGSVVEEKAVD